MTKELIEEVRETSTFEPGSDYDSAVYWRGVAQRLADALEESYGERDAAVATIERVRAMHRPINTKRYTWCVECSEYSSVVDWPCETFEALDGAPEPEWEWAVRATGDDEPFSDVYQTREHLAEQETGIAWGEEQLVRRRPAGPWLPVEGESK